MVSPPSNHYTEDRKPQDHDTTQIFLSPSIKYAGCSAYAPPDRSVHTYTKHQTQLNRYVYICVYIYVEEAKKINASTSASDHAF